MSLRSSGGLFYLRTREIGYVGRAVDVTQPIYLRFYDPATNTHVRLDFPVTAKGAQATVATTGGAARFVSPDFARPMELFALADEAEMAAATAAAEDFYIFFTRFSEELPPLP